MLYKKISTVFLSALACFYCVPSDAALPFYLGLTGGYGATTWGQLVPQNANVAMSLSTPTQVSESGFAWGVVGGYEFIPQI